MVKKERRPASIALQTAAGNSIPNEQIGEVSTFEENQHVKFENTYGSSWIERRSPPLPRYNCHGMTFACRRTGVFDSWAIEQILEDDGYVEIEPGKVLAGDVALYYDEAGEIEHSATVLEPPSKNRLGVALVASKWGKFAEVIHWANRCPYHAADIRYFRVKK